MRFPLMKSLGVAAAAVALAGVAAPAQAGDYHRYHGGWKSHHHSGHGYRHGYKRGYRHGRHDSRHYHKGLKAGEVAAIAGGVVLGAVVLDKLLDPPRSAPYVYSPPPPVYRTSYPARTYPRPAYAPPPPAYGGSASGPVTFDFAYQTCVSQARRMMGEEGLVNAQVDSVRSSQRYDDGAWEVDFVMTGSDRGYMAERGYICSADRGGVRAIRTG